MNELFNIIVCSWHIVGQVVTVVLDMHWLESWTALVLMCLLAVCVQAAMVPNNCFHHALIGMHHILNF